MIILAAVLTKQQVQGFLIILEDLEFNPRVQEGFGELGTVLHKPRSLGSDQ